MITIYELSLNAAKNGKSYPILEWLCARDGILYACDGKTTANCKTILPDGLYEPFTLREHEGTLDADDYPYTVDDVIIQEIRT